MSTLEDALFAQADMTGAVLHVLDPTEDWPTAIEDIAHHIEYVVASSDPASRCNDTVVLYLEDLDVRQSCCRPETEHVFQDGFGFYFTGRFHLSPRSAKRWFELF